MVTVQPGSFDNLGPFAEIKTCSARMFAVFRYLEVVAVSRQPVLIHGETGVGKELMVRALHNASGLTGPMVAVNVAGLDGTMFSDTLFGHIRGAYSGADSARRGLVAEAEDGTLFLDEIGDLDQESQIKLLRMLQEKVYYPLGSDITRPTNARIACATNMDLKDRVEQGLFRADLYYRLAAHSILVPPLRERPEDIPLLAKHFIENSAIALNKPVPEISPDFLHRLGTYSFPGNIRELQAIIHDVVARHPGGVLPGEDGNIKPDNYGCPINNLPFSLPQGKKENIFSFIDGPLPTFKEVERQLMEEALRRSDGNQGAAATMLGISRTALNRRIQVEQRRRQHCGVPCREDESPENPAVVARVGKTRADTKERGRGEQFV